jgi:hypothetical protein
MSGGDPPFGAVIRRSGKADDDDKLDHSGHSLVGTAFPDEVPPALALQGKPATLARPAHHPDG